MSSSSSSSRIDQDIERWTIRGMVAAHKRASLLVAAGCGLMLAMLLLAVLGAKPGRLTDTSTCTQWASTNTVRQKAYAKLYVEEHGAAPLAGTSTAGIVSAITISCLDAYDEDVSDSTTVVQALSGKF
jgi:hypothetical protein